MSIPTPQDVIDRTSKRDRLILEKVDEESIMDLLKHAISQMNWTDLQKTINYTEHYLDTDLSIERTLKSHPIYENLLRVRKAFEPHWVVSWRYTKFQKEDEGVFNVYIHIRSFQNTEL